MDSLLHIDWQLLLWINHLHHPFADKLFITISNKFVWIPLYILLGIYLIKYAGLKNGIIIILSAFLCFAVTDLVCAKMIKVWVGRLRPCHTSMGQLNLWLPEGCGGKYGFVSNHASNTMGLAFTCILFIRNKINASFKWTTTAILIAYAFLNGLSRIYLGKHFPSDVLGGWLFGAIVAALIYLPVSKLFFSKNN